MLEQLDSLNCLVHDEDQPQDFELVLYLFWEKGIGWNEFKEYPLPYIFSIMKSHHYIKKLEEKEVKKAQRKK